MRAICMQCLEWNLIAVPPYSLEVMRRIFLGYTFGHLWLRTLRSWRIASLVPTDHSLRSRSASILHMHSDTWERRCALTYTWFARFETTSHLIRKMHHFPLRR